MKSIRLNKKLRTEIISNIEQAYVIKNPAPEYKTKGVWFNELVTPLLREAYRKEAEEVLAKCDSVGIPRYSLQTNYCFAYAIDGEFIGSVNHVEEDPCASKNKLPVLSKGVHFDLTKDMEGEIGDAYREYLSKTKRIKQTKEAWDKWDLAKRNYIADVTNVIEGVNTTSQLLDVWEECERFIPKGLVDPSSISLPSVNIASLNKCI